LNIGSLFSRHAQYRSDQLAVVCGTQRLTYRQYNSQINRLANALAGIGIRKGDKVATILPNCLELLETYWAVGKIGGVVVPMSTLLLEPAMQSLLNDSDAKAVITTSGFSRAINNIRGELPGIADDRYILTDGSEQAGFQGYHMLKSQASEAEPADIHIAEQDPFNIMYSSGTTGLPKGIVHSHAVRAWYGATFASCFRMTPESVTMHAGAIVFNDNSIHANFWG
jgi:acyl-coenzyme A synthetase/AMP-(fatty) acid ligase